MIYICSLQGREPTRHKSIQDVCFEYHLNPNALQHKISAYKNKGLKSCETKGVTITWTMTDPATATKPASKPYQQKKHVRGAPLLRGHVTHRIH